MQSTLIISVFIIFLGSVQSGSVQAADPPLDDFFGVCTHEKCMKIQSVVSHLSKKVLKLANEISVIKKKIPAAKKKKVIGFSASLHQTFKSVRNHQRIVFGNVLTNTGNHYNKNNGIFTAPEDGMYVFQWTIMTHNGKNGDTAVMVNGVLKRKSACDSNSKGKFGYRAGAATVVLSLKRNDKVWIATWAKHLISGKDWSGFQGWLQN